MIAGVAFAVVRDYMSDGYIKHAVADFLNQAAGSDDEARPILIWRCRHRPRLTRLRTSKRQRFSRHLMNIGSTEALPAEGRS